MFGLSVVGWCLLFLWPEARNMLVLQLRLITHSEPRRAGYVTPWFRPGGCSIPAEPSVEVKAPDLLWLADSGKGYAPDALVAAAVVTGYSGDAEGDTAQKAALDRLIAAAPAEPRTWAVVLHQYWRSLGTAAGDWHGAGEPPRLAPDEHRAIVTAIRSGRSRAPQNALWTLGDVLVAAADKDDSDVQRALLRLSEASYFTDYWQEQGEALTDACERLGHSRYRAVLYYYERANSAEVLVWPLVRVAAQLLLLEQRGSHVEALRMYAAVAHLDRLMMDERTSHRYPERPPVFALRRLATERYKRVGEPWNDAWDWREKEGWEGRAWDSLVDYALAHGDVGLAMRAGEIHREWREGRLAARRGEGIVDRLLGPILIAAGFWWFQLVLLGFSVVATCGALMLRRVSVGLAREPQVRFALQAAGPAVALTSGLLLAVLFGLAPPSYGLGAASSPPTLTARIVFAVFMGLAALSLRFLVVRAPSPLVRKIGDYAFATARWLAVVCSFLYVALTLGQAWFQSWAAAKLPPW